jgi:hypothetical protein
MLSRLCTGFPTQMTAGTEQTSKQPIVGRYVINCPDRCRRAGVDQPPSHSLSSIAAAAATAPVGDNREVFLLIVVHSAVDHFERRARIRRTWANETLMAQRVWRRPTHVEGDAAIRMETVFFVGRRAPKVTDARLDDDTRREANETEVERKRRLLSDDVQVKLEAEAAEYRDIVQGDFIDSYRCLFHLDLRVMLTCSSNLLTN